MLPNPPATRPSLLKRKCLRCGCARHGNYCAHCGLPQGLDNGARLTIPQPRPNIFWGWLSRLFKRKPKLPNHLSIVDGHNAAVTFESIGPVTQTWPAFEDRVTVTGKMQWSGSLENLHAILTAESWPGPPPWSPFVTSQAWNDAKHHGTDFYTDYGVKVSDGVLTMPIVGGLKLTEPWPTPAMCKFDNCTLPKGSIVQAEDGTIGVVTGDYLIEKNAGRSYHCLRAYKE